MQNTSYRPEIRVSVSPQVAYRALTQAVARWWGRVTNPIRQAGDTFMTHFDLTFWTFRLIEAIPYTRLYLEWFAANHIGTILHISTRENGWAPYSKGNSKLPQA